MSTQPERKGFVLNYEDHDRAGVYGASFKLNADTLENALAEARTFLTLNAARLPQQKKVMVSERYELDVSDIPLGK